MPRSSRQRAVANYRHRLAERGVSRYEVRGLEKDKELVRKLVKRLSEDDAGAARLRADIAKTVGKRVLTGRQILEALRHSPLVGADLNLERDVVPPRDTLPNKLAEGAATYSVIVCY